MDYPLDTDGVCMKCKASPNELDCMNCSICMSPWHTSCLSVALEISDGKWTCPDCDITCVPETEKERKVIPTVSGELVLKTLEIESDQTISVEERARKRQELFNAHSTESKENGKKNEEKSSSKDGHKEKSVSKVSTLAFLDERMNCAFCLNLVDRPVTTPCGHNFCLKCFQKWIAQGKRNCAKCRSPIPPKMASQPRINSVLVVAIRIAKTSSSSPKSDLPRQYHYISNKDRPEKAFTTERAIKTGKANACSGRIFVTIPPDHFGPITKEYDPERNQGVLVGETWEDRMECRQWGAHFSHVAGIAGQSEYGAQSVALSGGYEDDMDMGEYFLYTGSGGRDLSGNKRTNKEHSFDQKFEAANEALRTSCKKGYPLRVVRSHKEKRSNYAPETGVRYDGIYRIEKCWRKKGAGGHLVCRYLFLRCDNEPAPWTCDDHGDRPRELPHIPELKEAIDLTERKGKAAWDWIDEREEWGWICDPPVSRLIRRKTPSVVSSSKRKHVSLHKKLLKEFCCRICNKVLNQPVSTPCGHNFCKNCLVSTFGSDSVRNRSSVRSLRAQKLVKPCPAVRCGQDISDIVNNPKVNLEMVDVIESLKKSDNNEGDSDAINDENEESDMKKPKNENTVS